VYKPATVNFRPGTRLGICLLALLFFLPSLAAFFTNDEARAKWEKRELATLETAREAGSAKQFFARLDSYLDDHIGFALELNRIYRQVQFYIFKDSPVVNVDVGEDGFVFLNSHATVRPHSELTKLCLRRPILVAQVRETLEILAASLADQRINMTLALVPSKLVLYPDRLPDTVPRKLRAACSEINPQDTVAGQLAHTAVGAAYQVYYPVSQMLALRDEPAFYPPQNFHANSRLNHEFAKGFLAHMGVDPGENYSNGAYLARIRADLPVLGFSRWIDAWKYRYPTYKITRAIRQPDWVLKYYSRVPDFSTYSAANPLSERTVVLLSNSFGAYIAPHLAPGFKTLYHVNVSNLSGQEARIFFEELMARTGASDFIYLVHDAGLPNRAMTRLARSLRSN
jgi:hypothetical protein